MIRAARLRMITTFGLGHLRPASGTWGSLPPVALGAALVLLHQAPPVCGAWGVPWYVIFGLMLLAFSWACVLRGDEAEAAFGKKDPGQVVADETAGMALTILLLPHAPLGATWSALYTLALAFVAFRVADIVKLWPAGALQRVRGGWGILLDDLVAGVQAAAVVWAAWWWGGV